MEQLVNDLIKYFLKESSYPVIDIPTNYVNKREFLRGLINVREAKPIPKEIIEKENELLRLELEEKKIKDIDEFTDKFSLWQGDITCIKCDGIVNFTDKILGCSIPNHNCISNKIHSYAGINLRLKCKEITKGIELDECKTILTEGYNLPCDYIIHTIKRNVIELNDNEKELIRKFYINSLDLAKKNNIKKICVPNISVNPELKEEVAKISIECIKEYLKEDDFFEKIVFNVFTLDNYNIYSVYF